MDSWINLHALAEIVGVGLICGAGLPAVFALGLRALAMPPQGARAHGGDEERVVGGNPFGIAFAGICFALVVVAAGWGIYFVVAGT